MDKREREQLENMKIELAQAKAKRQAERESRARCFGVLNKRHTKSEEKIKRERMYCTCGAIERGTIHNDSCAVVRAARNMR